MSNILDKLDDYNNLYEFVKSEISSYHFNKWTDDTGERDIKYRTFKIQTNFKDLIDNFKGTPGTDPDLTRPTTSTDCNDRTMRWAKHSNAHGCQRKCQ